MKKHDVVFIGISGTGRKRQYAITGNTAKGRSWLKKHYKLPGLMIAGMEHFRLGPARLVPFVKDLLDAQKLTYRVLEL